MTDMRARPFVPRLLATVVVVLGVLLVVRTARAQPQVHVQVTEGPGAQFAAQAGLPSAAALQTQLEGELNSLFQTYRLGDYLRSFADAQAFASRGMGVDYASNFRWFTVGVVGNLSLNVQDGYVPKDTHSQPAVGGVAPNATLMAGVNLDALGLGPIKLYGNWFSRSDTIDDFDVHLSNWGVHAQLKLFGPGSEGLLNALLRWGGIDITTGVEHAHTTFVLSQGWKRNISVGAAGTAGSPFVALESTGQFTVDMHTLDVPLEVTTNLRLLYILSLYGGFGFDWQLDGRSDMVLNLNGTMTGVTTSNGQQQRVSIGTAAVTASDAVTPSASRLRWLLGLQANVLFVKLFVQLNLVTQNPVLASVALGARLAF